jgi:hypothetical protein
LVPCWSCTGISAGVQFSVAKRPHGHNHTTIPETNTPKPPQIRILASMHPNLPPGAQVVPSIPETASDFASDGSQVVARAQPTWDYLIRNGVQWMTITNVRSR